MKQSENTKQKISVIVPVYKVEQYLHKCLDSIVNQTYDNLEIILVDDGSPDRCGAICDEYAAKDSRIIVIHQKNAGVSAARNAALEIATGDYIGFADSDDWLEPDMYEYLMGLALRRDAGIVQCGYVEEGQTSLELYTFCSDRLAEGGTASFTKEDWHSLSYANWNKLYRAELIGDTRFDTDFVFGEDLLFNVQMIRKPGKVCFGAQAKYHYLQRQGSACYQDLTPEYLKVRQKAIEQVVLWSGSDPVAKKFFLGTVAQGKLDICSRIICCHTEHLAAEKAAIRSFMRRHLSVILCLDTVSLKDRAKCAMIAYAWWLYRFLLPVSKSVKGGKRA